MSNNVNIALRKVVTSEEGTASFANIDGYEVAGKQELRKSPPKVEAIEK